MSLAQGSNSATIEPAEGSEGSAFESIDFRGVDFTYDTGTQALKGINFSVRAGEFVTVLGESGCGKSTLFNLAAGLAEPTGGEVALNGQALRGTNSHVAYMFQHDALLDWRTVLRNVTLGPEFLGIRKSDAEAEARQSLEDFGLKGFEDRRPYELSGGMRQRVALARTYATKRPLLLLDEPFGALDALTRARMQEFLLERWETHGRTVIFITHDVDEALLLGDRLVVLSQRPGSVLADIPIPVDRPRNPSTMVTQPEITELKASILKMLRGPEAQEA